MLDPVFAGARKFLSQYLPQTRLIASRSLTEFSQQHVYLKLECELPTGSFKVRGALYALGALIPTDSLADWNDDPRQTQANVVAVLERAAAECADNYALVELSLN